MAMKAVEVPEGAMNPILEPRTPGDGAGEKLRMNCISVILVYFLDDGWLTNSKIKVTSRPKASNGQRFPCPSLLFSVFIGGSRAAALIGDKVL